MYFDFRGDCQQQKLKTLKVNAHIFQPELQKIGDAKILQYKVLCTEKCQFLPKNVRSFCNALFFSKNISTCDLICIRRLNDFINLLHSKQPKLWSFGCSECKRVKLMVL